MDKMRFPAEATVEKVRKEYPTGCRVELVEMDDVQAPPIGTKGTVIGVDDTASIMVQWDNGSSLHVVYGVDCCRKVEGGKQGGYTERKDQGSEDRDAAYGTGGVF